MTQAVKRMTRLCIVKTGQTTFEAERRVESAAGSPLTAQGLEEIRQAARQLVSQNIGAIYASAAEGEAQTAELLAKALKVKVRTEADLREIDFGLWQGLTTEEIKRRQPKVFRLWNEAPTTVRPPGGETLAEAQQRLRLAVLGIIKRHKTGSPLVVLRPVALGLLRCLLEDNPPESIWQQVDPAFVWSSYEMDPKTI